MSNWTFVAAAYGLTWAVLALLALYVNLRVRRAADALAGLETSSAGAGGAGFAPARGAAPVDGGDETEALTR